MVKYRLKLINQHFQLLKYIFVLLISFSINIHKSTENERDRLADYGEKNNKNVLNTLYQISNEK